MMISELQSWAMEAIVKIFPSIPPTFTDQIFFENVTDLLTTLLIPIAAVIGQIALISVVMKKLFGSQFSRSLSLQMLTLLIILINIHVCLDFVTEWADSSLKSNNKYSWFAICSHLFGKVHVESDYFNKELIFRSYLSHLEHLNTWLIHNGPVLKDQIILLITFVKVFLPFYLLATRTVSILCWITKSVLSAVLIIFGCFKMRAIGLLKFAINSIYNCFQLFKNTASHIALFAKRVANSVQTALTIILNFNIKIYALSVYDRCKRVISIGTNRFVTWIKDSCLQFANSVERELQDIVSDFAAIGEIFAFLKIWIVNLIPNASRWIACLKDGCLQFANSVERGLVSTFAAIGDIFAILKIWIFDLITTAGREVAWIKDEGNRVVHSVYDALPDALKPTANCVATWLKDGCLHFTNSIERGLQDVVSDFAAIGEIFAMLKMEIILLGNRVGLNQGRPNPARPNPAPPNPAPPNQGHPRQSGPSNGNANQGRPSNGGPQQGRQNPGGPQQGRPSNGGPQQGRPNPGGPQQGRPSNGNANQGGSQQGRQSHGQMYLSPLVIALAVFGLGPSATEKEVCKAWRDSVSKLHSDKTVGWATEKRKAADDEFIILNNLKDFIVEQIRLNKG